ncbi:MAG TPA: UbiD family decarboxylase [Terriglobia bacterium]|nr:UbiD family decarboxylase [Terriglobia bacterium]
MNLRPFIDLLSKEGCLKRVSELVDWKCELGEITRSNSIPLLFENIKGYAGLRVFTNGLSNLSSMALALGLQPGTDHKTIVREAQRKAAAPLKPVLSDRGSVLENVVEGQDINLLRFPVPQWSKYDAGRYIGTWHANVTHDPETGSRNLGVYRMQVLSRNQATVSTSGNSHLAIQFAKAEKQGRPLQMAVVIGAAETVIMAAAAACPFGSDEYDLAGGLGGESVQLVRCLTVNVEVPAESEIVIEGFVKPGVRVKDGPYLDFAGKPTTNPNAFVFEATRLMYRNNPILRGAAVGHYAAEDQQLFSVLSELDLFDFHNSRPRHQLESLLIKSRLFRAFQLAGGISVPAFLRKRMKNLTPNPD